jgi:hypothetical protein
MWLYVVLDDVGFGALGCCGGIVDTPNIDRIAESWFAKTVGTPRRCAPRPGPACDRAKLPLIGRVGPGQVPHHSPGLRLVHERRRATEFPERRPQRMQLEDWPHCRGRRCSAVTTGTKGPPIDLGIGPVDVLGCRIPRQSIARSNPGTATTSWTCTHARPAAGSVPRTGPPTDMRFTLGRCARLSSGGRGLHPRASHLRLPPGLFGRGVTASATNYSARVCLSLSTAASRRHMTSTARNGKAFTWATGSTDGRILPSRQLRHFRTRPLPGPRGPPGTFLGARSVVGMSFSRHVPFTCDR